jgi:hypothetical protein
LGVSPKGMGNPMLVFPRAWVVYILGSLECMVENVLYYREN